MTCCSASPVSTVFVSNRLPPGDCTCCCSMLSQRFSGVRKIIFRQTLWANQLVEGGKCRHGQPASLRNSVQKTKVSRNTSPRSLHCLGKSLLKLSAGELIRLWSPWSHSIELSYEPGMIAVISPELALWFPLPSTALIT